MGKETIKTIGVMAFCLCVVFIPPVAMVFTGILGVYVVCVVVWSIWKGWLRGVRGRRRRGKEGEATPGIQDGKVPWPAFVKGHPRWRAARNVEGHTDRLSGSGRRLLWRHV